MAIYFKLYQNNQKKNPNRGKWYARPAYQETVNERDLAAEIEKKTTVHTADILAVLQALSEQIAEELRDSKRVHLTGLGTFKIGISTSPAGTRDDFKANVNIKHARVLFQPETRGTGEARTRALLSGITYKEWTSGNKHAASSSDTGTTTSGGSEKA